MISQTDYINKLLMLREFIQADYEHMREMNHQMEKLMIDRIDKYLAQADVNKPFNDYMKPIKLEGMEGL